MRADAYPALMLNADWTPLNLFPLSTLPWEKTIKAVVEGTVSVVAEYDAYVRSPSTQIRIPSVVALRRYQKVPNRVAFTRFNVFLRDRFRCQYCGEKHPELTFDHVVPRSKGGITSWTNVVAACSPCNLRKGSRTDIRPMTMPREPGYHELLAVKRMFPPRYLHESWLDFAYWDSELEA